MARYLIDPFKFTIVAGDIVIRENVTVTLNGGGDVSMPEEQSFGDFTLVLISDVASVDSPNILTVDQADALTIVDDTITITEDALVDVSLTVLSVDASEAPSIVDDTVTITESTVDATI